VAKFISINASYRIKGGADRFFSVLNSLLQQNGHQVLTFTTAPENQNSLDSYPPGTFFTSEYKEGSGIRQKIGNLIRIFFSSKISADLENVLEKEKPDYALIHNIYHRMPYSIVKTLKKNNVKILWWLHDYKWICPNHQLFTSGSVCRRCLNSSYLNAVFFRCQRGSVVDSIIVTLLSYYISIRRYHKYVDCFIAPSEFSAQIHSNLGKVVHIEHFNHTIHSSVKTNYTQSKYPYALYVGRVEPNKGIQLLVDSFAELDFKLKIVGGGNFLEEIRNYCKFKQLINIEFDGFQPPEKLSSYYSSSLFTIVPSQWYEVFGLSILESFSFGKPVVASRIGAIPEIIEHGKSGLLYDAYNKEDLKEKITYMFNHHNEAIEMGRYAQNRVLEKYSPVNYMQKLQNLIDSLH